MGGGGTVWIGGIVVVQTCWMVVRVDGWVWKRKIRRGKGRLEKHMARMHYELVVRH